MHRLVIEVDQQLYRLLENAARASLESGSRVPAPVGRRRRALEVYAGVAGRVARRRRAAARQVRPSAAGDHFFLLPAVQLAASKAWSMTGLLLLYTVKR